MDCRIALFLLAVMSEAAAAGGPSETKTLTAKVGENITLNTGISDLHSDSEIFWTYGPHKDLIINTENGKLRFITKERPERFELDQRTGSLTIRSLNISDSGLYYSHIVTGNDLHHNFNLTVVEPDPIPTTAGPPQNATAPGPDRGTQRITVAAGVSFGLLGIVCIVLLVCAVRQKKINGNCWCKDEVV